MINGPSGRDLVRSLIVAVALVGCGSAPGARPSDVAGTPSAEGTTVPSGQPSATSLRVSTAPLFVSPTPGPVASAAGEPSASAAPASAPLPSAGPSDAGRSWIEIGRGQLFGVASTGDAIVTGGPPASFRRYGTGGILLGSVPMGRSVLDFGGWMTAAVDPTDDSILLFRPNPGRAVRVSATTGEVVASYEFPSGLAAFAVDGSGRMYLVCGVIRSSACDPATDPGLVLQYERSGKLIVKRQLSDASGRCLTGVIVALGPATDGGIRGLEHDFGGPGCDQPGAVHAIELTGDLRRVAVSGVPYEAEYNLTTGPTARSVAGDVTGMTLIADVPWRNATLDEFRLRRVSADGGVADWWGFGGDLSGPRNPSTVALSPDGTIWVLDADPGTNIGRLMYLAPPG